MAIPRHAWRQPVAVDLQDMPLDPIASGLRDMAGIERAAVDVGADAVCRDLHDVDDCGDDELARGHEERGIQGLPKLTSSCPAWIRLDFDLETRGDVFALEQHGGPVRVGDVVDFVVDVLAWHFDVAIALLNNRALICVPIR